jgi:type IV secretion system protein VirD4
MNSKHKYLLTAGTALGVAGIFGAPYIVGAAADFHPALGGVARDIFTFPIYTPADPYLWAKNAEWWPASLIAAMTTSVASTALALGSAVANGYTRVKKQPEQFGAAGWGTVQDARTRGLISTENPGSHSIVIGMLDGHYLCINGDESGLVTGPARSGKTRSALLTTGVNWRGSAAIYTSGAMDAYNATSGWRSTFSDIRVLDFGELKNCINPLDEIRLGTPFEISDTESISTSFPPEPASKARIPWWPLGGTRVTTAAILHVLYTMPPPQRTLGSVYRFLHQTDTTVRRVFSESPHSFIRETFNSIPEGAGNPIDTARSYLRPWANPIVDQVTARSDFSFSSLVTGARPVTLYFHIPEDIREALLPVLQVLVSTLTKALLHTETHTRDGRLKRHKMLLALDEFHTFFVEGFDTTLAVMPKYGVRALLLTQSPKSLEELYGRNQTIETNTQHHLHFPTNDAHTAEKISKSIGEITEIREIEGKSANLFDFIWTERSKREQEVTRRIIDAGGVRSMKKGKAFVLSTNSPPFLVDTLMDFDTRAPFKKRMLPPYPGPFHIETPSASVFQMGDF